MSAAKERLRELALEIAMANGVKAVELYRGRAYEAVGADYQAAIGAFDQALDEIFPNPAQTAKEEP